MSKALGVTNANLVAIGTLGAFGVAAYVAYKQGYLGGGPSDSPAAPEGSLDSQAGAAAGGFFDSPGGYFAESLESLNERVNELSQFGDASQRKAFNPDGSPSINLDPTSQWPLGRTVFGVLPGPPLSHAELGLPDPFAKTPSYAKQALDAATDPGTVGFLGGAAVAGGLGFGIKKAAAGIANRSRGAGGGIQTQSISESASTPSTRQAANAVERVTIAQPPEAVRSLTSEAKLIQATEPVVRPYQAPTSAVKAPPPIEPVKPIGPAIEPPRPPQIQSQAPGRTTTTLARPEPVRPAPAPKAAPRAAPKPAGGIRSGLGKLGAFFGAGAAVAEAGVFGLAQRANQLGERLKGPGRVD